jgi:glycine/D-amino acid oxidase-like deaminating enzyme
MEDVVVVGAGPVGLFLAAELALGGLRVTVLDRDPDPAAQPIKQGEMGARSLNAPSVHALRRRGLLPAIRAKALMWWGADDAGLPPRPGTGSGTGSGDEPVFAGHFAGIMLRADRIDVDDPDMSPERIDIAQADAALEVAGLLIRPDGVVCWAGDDPSAAAEAWPVWLGRAVATTR